MLSRKSHKLFDRWARRGAIDPLRFGKQEIDTMLNRLGVTLGALGLVTGGLALGTPAQADVRVGVMTCDMDSGFGYVLGSSRDLHCTFVPAAGAPEHYSGTISKFGVDIGYVQNAVIVWTVIARLSRCRQDR
jgi:hypothetical protein